MNNASRCPHITTDANSYNGYSLIKHRGPFIVDYLNANEHVLNEALKIYPRMLAIRFDLHFHPDSEGYDTRVISRFSESLKAQIAADYIKRVRQGKRRFESTPKYIWVKERKHSPHCHYHVVIFLNKDAYNDLGDFKAKEGNMAARIKKAWASALGESLDDVARLVHFPKKNPVYRLDRNKPDFEEVRSKLLTRISYFAKEESKDFTFRNKVYGTSS